MREYQNKLMMDILKETRDVVRKLENVGLIITRAYRLLWIRGHVPRHPAKFKSDSGL